MPGRYFRTESTAKLRDFLAWALAHPERMAEPDADGPAPDMASLVRAEIARRDAEGVA